MSLLFPMHPAFDLATAHSWLMQLWRHLHISRESLWTQWIALTRWSPSVHFWGPQPLLLPSCDFTLLYRLYIGHLLPSLQYLNSQQHENQDLLKEGKKKDCFLIELAFWARCAHFLLRSIISCKSPLNLKDFKSSCHQRGTAWDMHSGQYQQQPEQTEDLHLNPEHLQAP